MRTLKFRIISVELIAGQKMRTCLLVLLLIALSGCSGKNISTRDIKPEALPTDTGLEDEDIFSSAGIKRFDSLVDETLTRDSFSNVVVHRIGFRLPDEKMQKIDPEDLETLRQAFDRARDKVFEGYPLSDKVDSGSLVINTYLTDQHRSYPVVNVALWIIVPSLAVGAAAIETEAVIDDKLVAAAVGARNGTIGVSGYTEWGVIEQGFEIWLAGMRQWIEELSETEE
jgi:hypothetical protein